MEHTGKNMQDKDHRARERHNAHDHTPQALLQLLENCWSLHTIDICTTSAGDLIACMHPSGKM